MEARDVDLRYINRSDPREELAAMGLFPTQNEVKDVDLRYNNGYDPREELAAMGLLPSDNEIKGLDRQQENEMQIKNPAAELAAMGLLPQQNFGGRPDETECMTRGVRKDVPARTSHGASRKQSSPNRASRKRSSSPSSSSSRKRTPPKETKDNVKRFNPDRRATAGNGAFSADDACNMLMVICDKLGIIGVSFKSVLKRALEFEPDTHKMLKVFQESDTLSLMEVVSQKINDSAQNPKNNYDKEIMKKASIYIRTLIEKSKQECSEIIHGIDISHLAHVTFGKETKYIIQMIKTETEYNGVRCPQSILSEIFQKVSMRHFSIMKSNENHNKSLSTCNSLDSKTDVENPKLLLHSSDNRVGVSELLRSENRKMEPLGLTESLMQVNNNKPNSDKRGNNQFDKGLAQNRPYKGNRDNDTVDRKSRDLQEVDGRLHTDDRSYIRERDSVDRKFRDIREPDRRKDLPYRNERDAHERRYDFDERKKVHTNFDKGSLRKKLPNRGNNIELDSVDRNMRVVDERKDIMPENLHNRNERDGQGRRDRFEEVDHHYRQYGRKNESRNGKINQNERENYKRNGSVPGDHLRYERGHLSKQGASRQNKPHRDIEDINRELRIRNKAPKFCESTLELIKKDERITKIDETPEEVSPKMPSIREMMEDLEQMQAMAEKEKENNEAQLPEGEMNEDLLWRGPEGELDKEQGLDQVDTEDHRDNREENIETELDVHDNDDIDDNLKETFGNKCITEVPWQELVKKLAPKGMIDPTDIDDDEDEYFENRNNAHDMMEPTAEDYLEHNENNSLDDYGNHRQYNRNIGPDDGYMNSYNDNLNENNYYDNQNPVENNLNYENSNIDLKIPVKFMKDRSSNNENEVRNNSDYLQGNRTQFPEYQRNEYGNVHQYHENQNYDDQRIREHELNTNAGYDYFYEKLYDEESTQSTNTSHRGKSDSYNSYDYSSEAHQSSEYDPVGSTSYSEDLHESHSYSQTMGANPYNYIDQNSRPYQSGYKDESLYQSGYKDESLYQSGYKDESADHQYKDSYKNLYNDSGYEAESSEYSVEMPVEFIKPKKTLEDSLQNTLPQNTPPQNSNNWLADQIKALATSNLGKEELAAKMAQIFNPQKSVR